MSDPIIRANQWRQAYSEEGGLKDIFEGMRSAYFRRAGKLDPSLPPDVRANALERLSFASNVVDMVEDHVRSIIDSGKLEEHNALQAEKIAGLPEHRRRWIF